MKRKTSLITGFLILAVCIAAFGGCSGKVAESGVGEDFEYKIYGIDPGAGIMMATEKAIEEYNLEKWELVESSGTAMTAALTQAYKNNEPIIVTGWTPHWKFAKYDLKYLEDPKNIYGGDEQIHTIVRKGLKEDHPSAYAFLDKFSWEPADMESVMVEAMDSEFESAAANWVKANGETVDSWVEGLEPADGDSISLAFVAWDSELASTNVVRIVLEERLGYQVEMVQLDVGPMYTSVADGDNDALVAAWLPTTHADYMDRFSEDFEDLGPNLNGTKIGLVVPSYVEINSIEDLVD